MKISLALFSAVAVQGAPSFEDWAAQYGFNWNSDDEKSHREKIYNGNVAFIENENAKQSGYSLTWNQFTMYTNEEVQARFTGWKALPDSYDNSSAVPFVASKEMAESVDWASQGYVSAVKDQGHCGSCWAFAATGALESRIAILANSYPPIISEQQLVDCSRNVIQEGINGGCDGGNVGAAYYYYATVWSASCTGDDYPYTGTNYGSCRTSCTAYQWNWGSTGFVAVPEQNEYALKNAVMTTPVAVALNAEDSFVYYSSGVLTGYCNGATTHAVVMVGYDSTSLKLKNSWGSGWGDSGYIRVSSGTNAFFITAGASFYPQVSVSSTASGVSMQQPAKVV